MNIQPLRIPDVLYVTPTVFEDARGYFFESYHEQKFKDLGILDHFVQDNQSRSSQGTLRGLHYQLPPVAQSKLIRVLSGSIFDVAVDIRQGSPTFGKWVGATLSAEKKDMLYIPKGFAHGFYVVSDSAEILYKCSDFYTPSAERSIRYNDPNLGIQWPFSSVQPPILSAKDTNAPFLNQIEPKELF